MAVDVLTEIVIECPRDQVSAYAADPAHATAWYRNIKQVDVLTDGPLGTGSRAAFVAEFLGRRLSYIYEVREFAPGERLVMGTSDGPFAMETTYTWRDSGSGGTLMTLRNRGRPAGFSRLTAPLMAASMGRANRNDLAALKQLLEAGAVDREA